MIEKYGNDAFRYFLLRESVFGLDADFREDDSRHPLSTAISRTTSATW